MVKTIFEEGLDIARNYNVTTPKDSVVLYSVSFQPSKENKDKAFAYIRNTPGKMMINHTDCGAKLVEMGFENSNGLAQEENMLVWAEASRRFIAAACGNITAFVDNADPRSVFVSVELPNILKNDKILTINGIDKRVFAKKFCK